ncbi:Uncharacterised protein [Mycobacteroides abscessus subsp. massiliense]|nr:Uncharacterised protein [Mycobacteroides abscessus subsp. abscessus]SID56774.1 Uncharacterised protein [Mycobacteroides abscessus subsp. abscessus]SKZ78876.1 Uncharacterised protein [Mycobacteroides abscessus subsp. massiliense]
MLAQRYPRFARGMQKECHRFAQRICAHNAVTVTETVVELLLSAILGRDRQLRLVVRLNQLAQQLLAFLARGGYQRVECRIDGVVVIDEIERPQRRHEIGLIGARLTAHQRPVDYRWQTRTGQLVDEPPEGLKCHIGRLKTTHLVGACHNGLLLAIVRLACFCCGQYAAAGACGKACHKDFSLPALWQGSG